MLTFEQFCKELEFSAVMNKDRTTADRVMLFMASLNIFLEIRKDKFETSSSMVHTSLYRTYHEAYLPKFQ